MSTEIWKPIPGFRGLYMVSSLGRLKGRGGKLIKAHSTGRTYVAHLWHRPSGGYRMFTMSRLVASLFVRPVGRHEIVRHRDGNNLNFAASNLVITRRDIVAKTWAVRGERSCTAKLTAAKVRSIRCQRKQGVPLSVLAEKYNVGEATISLVYRGLRWAHIAA